MSISGISFGGLASGLNTQSIISALMALEQRPITALENKRQSFKSQLGLFGTLETKLKELRDAVNDVRQSTNFLEFTATTSTNAYFAATAGNGAIAGSYQIAVNQLAESQSNQSGSYTSDTEQLVAGSATSRLEFTIDGTTTVGVDLQNATYSLQDIATAINGTGQGITARAVKVNGDDYRLVVTGELGEDKSFTVQGFGSAEVQALGTALDTNPLNAAQDAEIEIDNLAIRRNSNSISDAITGVTINLFAAEVGFTTTLTVDPDASATAEKVKDFVKAYNSVIDFIESQSQVDEEGNSSSPLFGDSTLRSVRSMMRSVAGGSSTATNTGQFNLLSQVGITADNEGRLTFKQSEFEAAVATDEDAVRDLFAGPVVPATPTSPSYGGIASRLYALTDDFLDTVDGLLVTRKNGFNDRIKDVGKQIEAAERRLEKTQFSLEQKFANLEVLLSQLQSQGSALGGLPSPASFRPN